MECMRISRLLAMGILLIVMLPCASGALAFDIVRVHPDLPALVADIQHIVLLPPRLAMYEIGAGGH